MKTLFVTLFVSSCLFFPVILFAQITPADVVVDSNKTVEITLADRSTLIGNIISVDDNELELRKDATRIFVQLSQIRSIREVDLTRKGALWFENPNNSRLFFSPTARPLKKGDGYYQNIYVFFNNFAYAATDNIAVTAGFTLLPTVRLTEQLYFLTGKFGMEVSPNNYLGGGLGLATAGGADEGLVIGYANYTRSFHRASLTGGVAGFTLSDSDAGTYAFYFGGDYRVSQRVALVTENFIFPESPDPFGISYGVRLMGQRMSFDLAYFQPGLGSDVGFGIPYVDVVINF
ncbi:MAG: hypothetical protein JJU13_14085 [Balneolaceae bacterium]|nr:hypothetical protein [Balneolaceae bacterium]